MLKHARIFILPLAASALLLSSGISAMPEQDVALDLSDLDLDEGYTDTFFGEGWYGDLNLRGNCLCASNPTLPFCITALDAPVLEVPGWGGFGDFGHHRRHHRGFRGPRS